MTIHTGKSLQDQLTDLKKRKPVCAFFESAINHPLKIVEDRFKCPIIDGCLFVVKSYPKYSNLKVLNDALLEFDTSYDPDIRSKLRL